MSLDRPIMQLRRIDGEDRELGTDHFAEPAVDAGPAVDDLRRVVPLAIEVLGHLEDLPGAVLDTERAALASVGASI
jgi:hypothetical protein